MFNSATYKKIAKKQLNNRWKTPVLAEALYLGIMLIISLPFLLANSGISSGFEYTVGKHSYSVATKMDSMYSLKFLTLYYFVIYAIYGIFNFAKSSFYIKMARTKEELNFSVFLEGFNHFILGILGIVWEALWLCLWAFLFYIPMFVKLYAYSRMFFILADNPKIGVRKALRLSKEITRGYKGDLFILDLSFIGYWILAVIPYILAFKLNFNVPGKMLIATLCSDAIQLYFMPYYRMTQTNAYLVLKEFAIKTGRVLKSDFDPDAADESEQWDPFNAEAKQTGFSQTTDTANFSHSKAESEAAQVVETLSGNTPEDSTDNSTSQASDVIQLGPPNTNSSNKEGDSSL